MNIALVIIDMQNDFVLPEAPLCVKGAQATVPTIQKLLDRARAEGWRVIHVIRQHRRDGSDVEIGRAPLFIRDMKNMGITCVTLAELPSILA